MARIIAGNLIARGRYPWHEWLDGQQRELTKGVDFSCGVHSMRTIIYAAARKRGIIAIARAGKDGQTVCIQAQRKK